jgi:hypothetical protein
MIVHQTIAVDGQMRPLPEGVTYWQDDQGRGVVRCEVTLTLHRYYSGDPVQTRSASAWLFPTLDEAEDWIRRELMEPTP